VVSKDEHVPEVERQNRVIKKRARAIIQTMPYQKLPKKMRIALIQYVVYWLNNIPKEGQEMSPREIIIGTQKLDFKNVCRIPFGAYAQVHNDLAITNTMDPRTTGAICLGPSGNIQGGHKFLSLQTGNVMVRRKWTELPVPADVINRLEDIAQDVNDSVERMLEEEDEEDNHEELGLNQNQDDSIREIEESTERNDDEQTGEAQTNGESLHEKNEQEQIQRDHDHQDQALEQNEEEREDIEVSPLDEKMITSNVSNHDKEHIARSGYNLRPKRTLDYSYQFALLSVKAGIKKWGD
jgi:hypothetical protein